MFIKIFTYLFFICLVFGFSSILLAQQNRTISGKVTSAEDASPVPLVNILVKGTTNSTTTDPEGKYKIVAKRTDKVLVFTAVGFEALEVPIGSRSKINVELKPDLKALPEIVTIGYGAQDRKALAGAVSSVGAKNIANLPMASIDQMLQGRAAGVQVSASSGTPASGMFVHVRGTTSINADNTPLYIIDGIPIANLPLSAIAVGGQVANPLADINPADIESIEIVKDATAAIYGARAANGVVIVKTKRGAETKPKVTLGAYWGTQSAWKKPQVLSNGAEFERLMNEAASNNGGRPPFSSPDAAISTDWNSQIFQNAPISNYDISVAGGDAKTRYLVSLNHFNQEAIIRPSNFNRTTARVNLDFSITDKLKVGTSLLLSRSIRNRGQNDASPYGALTSANFMPPNLPVYQPDGSYTKFTSVENPVAAANEQNYKMATNRFLGNLFVDYEISKYWNFRSSLSIDYSTNKDDLYFNRSLVLGAGTNGRAASAITIDNNWIHENTLSFQKNFTGAHKLGFLLGNALQESSTERTGAEGIQFPSNDFQRVSSSAIQTASSGATSFGLVSFFGRVNYAYKGKYLASVNVRRDGSSRFGSSNRWGTFPSVALGWRISEEKFLQSFSYITNIKLRTSYGLAGNQNFINLNADDANGIYQRDFISRGLWSGGANYTDVAGTEPVQLANPNLKWETTAQLNVGLDFSLLKNKVNVSVDYYNKQTKDLLVAVPLARSGGFNSQMQNIGAMENKGLEIGINATVLNKEEITWSASLNIAGNRNLIRQLPSPITAFSNEVVRLEEGYPMYSFWLHRQIGVDRETGNALWDGGEDGIFNPSTDRFIVGNAQPKYFGGFTNYLTWNGFDLMVFFQFSQGNSQLNWSKFFQEHGGTRNTNFSTSQLDRWQRSGDATMVPRMANGNYAANLRPSRFLEDGSYVRLKNITLGYSFPKEAISKLRMSNARVYVSAQNLLTFTKYTGLDPELNAGNNLSAVQGIEMYTMPQPRLFMAGFQVSF
jgi:TonB-dependent starch-binding outer membrane protein SusC